ncbi:MAG: metallophosphoesterase, partial [Proteobacteria bacterium]|nr:metallophosphoesterase [Pseudomonadota bacterium]
MTEPVTLAQLSDVHLPEFPRFRPRDLNLKRLTGMANWLLRRRRAHRRSALDAVIADLAIARPDHVAVTGDLVNFGLVAEHRTAHAWLEMLGAPTRLSVIPGNHDIYTTGSEAGVACWRAYMTGDAGEASFPYVRRVGHVALIGLNSALPTPPFRAYGRLGDEQLARLGSLLASLGREGLVRVVMVHHPARPGDAKPRKALEDAGRLLEVLSRHGAELVMHGHNHRPMLAFVAGPQRPVPVVGVGSASQVR